MSQIVDYPVPPSQGEAMRVLGLDQINATMVAEVGGKAANLGVLTAAGLPVPPGFCVTTDAYRQVVGDVLTQIHPQLASTDDPGELAQLAARARSLVLEAVVPPELQEAVLRRYRALASPTVAVRSSATAEDLDFASFAGQQDTLLNVLGESQVLDALRRCWASLWTGRAVVYRNSRAVDHSTAALAVVVQQMVQASVAGVMFTANPVTGTRHQTVIDASAGLGEAVVSGAVNPDHFVVDTDNCAVVERRLGDKRVVIRGLPGGGTERVDLVEAVTDAALTDRQVLELALLGSRVQEVYGSPQDTEWAVDEAGLLWLTQSRPITTLYPLPDASGQPGLRIFLCLTLAQGLTRPITPMGLAAFALIGSSIAAAAGRPITEPLDGPRAFTVIGQRAFVDFTGVLSNPVGRRAVVTIMGVMEARAAAVLQRLLRQREWSSLTSSRRSALRPVARVVSKVGLPGRVLVAAMRPAWAYRAIGELERRLRQQLEVPHDATAQQRLDHVQRLLHERVFWLMPTVVAYPIAGFGLLALARRLLRGMVTPRELQAVLRGLPHNVTTEMDLALWQLSRRIDADVESKQVLASTTAHELASRFRTSGLPAVAQDGLAAFLERYGHRAVAEIDLGMPRWSDEPTHLLGVIANYLAHDDSTPAPDVQFRDANVAAEAMVATLVARASQRSRLRAGLVGFSLRRARQLAGLREAPKNLLVLALAAIRAQLRLVGESLVESGSLDRADDVFFLNLAEARRGTAGARFQHLVAARREAYAAELRRRHIPRILLSDGTEPEAESAGGPSAGERSGVAADGALVGSPASAGLVAARARVILDPVGARLEPGEILVAPSTDPGWTPLFLTAGGLVMEMGGSNSHGAVVAREYGIPAVVGVPDATTLIETGQTITVDGAAGLVHLAGPTVA